MLVCWKGSCVLKLNLDQRRKHASNGAPLISLVWKQFPFHKVILVYVAC